MKRVLPLLVVVGLLACTASASALSYRPAGITAADTPLEAATAFVEQRPALVDGAEAEELVPAGETRGVSGTTIVRLDQELHGVPVLGGEVVVTVDAQRRVLAANGEVLDDASPAMGPSISAVEARDRAVRALDKGGHAGFVASEPSLVIYDARILGGPGPFKPALVWDLEVADGADVRQRVFVDATTGYIVQRMDLIRTAKVRHVCDAANSDGRVPCDSAFARTENGAPSLLADVNDAYDFAGVTYDFYAALGRDSIDGAGMPIVSTVRWCQSGCPYANAFWDGRQMVYGLSYATADDVVGHELTHGVTDYTSKLIYWYQPGAINEAMSDIMGEFVDLSNPGTSPRTDTAANRWLLGEDLPIGAIRDMENPPTYGDPDKVTSPNFFTGEADNGGVHTNSGVANKTAFLIADGATFNGQTVAGIGLTKSAWLWYQTELTLRFASGFADLADTLDASCATLATAGTAGITTMDCQQVAKATAATELRTDLSTPPAVCATGTPTDVFSEGFDGGSTARWTIGHTLGTSDLWRGSNQTSPDGLDMHWPTAASGNVRGFDSAVQSDSTMAMTTGVTVPADGYLSFSHWYAFESDISQGYDGGVVEYSSDGGPWTDVNGLPMINGYSGTINAAGNSDNPLQGRAAFVNGSNGGHTTRIDLSSLVGHSVRVRFRVATDTGGADAGWYIDSARIYGCGVISPIAFGSTSPASTPVAPAVVKTPPASGTWTVDGAADSVRVFFTRNQGTTYTIKAQRKNIVRVGVCRPIGTRIKCSINAPTGSWRVTVTPKVNGKLGKPIVRNVKT
ncbi:MAG: M4 family metallopeptidase [Thermoleophilia bacterium]